MCSPRAKWLVFIVAVAVVWFWVLAHVRIPPTRSLASRVLWETNSREAIRKVTAGAYVTFMHRVPAPSSHGDGMINARLIKRVGCGPGSMLSANGNDDYYCDGQYLGHAKRWSLSGKPLVPFCYNDMVPVGKLFVVGDVEDSYDSRYFGFIERADVEETGWSLF